MVIILTDNVELTFIKRHRNNVDITLFKINLFSTIFQPCDNLLCRLGTEPQHASYLDDGREFFFQLIRLFLLR